MPEGDTLRNLARAMGPWLEGRRLVRVLVHRLEEPALRERTVRAVRAVGKHLLIDLDDDSEEPLVLRTHLGLNGAWHRYPKGARWARAPHRSSLALETEDQVFVCFDAREVDVVPSRRLALHRPLTRLGPDLLAEEVDFRQIVQRARSCSARSHASIADLLLDQRVAAGIGNVFKSEVLFQTGHLPTTTPVRLVDQEMEELYRRARDMMLRNVGRRRRNTTGIERCPLWVYGRARRACLRCGTAIECVRPPGGRSTYWCPRCQA